MIRPDLLRGFGPGSLRLLRTPDMNPFIVKIGIGVIISAAAFFFLIWRNVQEEAHCSTRCGNFDGSTISICCVCLSDLTSESPTAVLPCKHKFHKQCINNVFAHQDSGRRHCPLCRDLISERFLSTF